MSQDGHPGYHPGVPKLSFPDIVGRDPRVWSHQCEDFFRFYNVLQYLWVTSAIMHMKGNIGQWFEIQRLWGGLNNWDQFIQAVEAKFGAYDFIQALNALLEIRQTRSVEEFAAEFASLQFNL